MAAWRTPLLALVLLWPAPCLAQDDASDDDSIEGIASIVDGSDEANAKEDTASKTKEDAAESDSDAEPAKAPAREWAFGPYLRFAWVPSFMLQLFTEEAPNIASTVFGVAATHRPKGGGVGIEVGLGYSSFAFEDPFRAKGDPVEDTEWLESNLGLAHLTGSLLWRSEFIPDKLALEYGIGADIGIVTGSLIRSEATRLTPGGAWSKCTGPLNPPTLAPDGTPYCNVNSGPGVDANGSVAYDANGEQYNVKEERIPPIALMPMLPRVGIAWSPIKDIVGKVDVAYGIFQFSLGLSIAYVPKI